MAGKKSKSVNASKHGASSKLTMGIDPFESGWIVFSIALVASFAALVSIAGFFMGFQIVGADQEVDPTTFTSEAPWSEPGLREIADGEYEAYVIAQTWTFVPRELVVPAGAKVTIKVSSPDIQHGFKVNDTNINMQIVPGQVSVLSHTFEVAGEYPIYCTEYCGQAHHQMYGAVKVVSQAEFDAQAEG